jgi:hypothetical protein
MNPQETTASSKGFLIAAAGTKTGEFAGFVPIEAARVTAISVKGKARTLASFGFDVAVDLPVGFPILFADEDVVTSITFTGTIYLIKRVYASPTLL